MLPALAELLRAVLKNHRTGWIVNPQPIVFAMKGQAPWFMPSLADLASAPDVQQLLDREGVRRFRTNGAAAPPHAGGAAFSTRPGHSAQSGC